MTLRRTAFLALLVGSLASPLAAKPQVIPVINLEFFGGQTRFDGDDGAFFGNGSWSFAPVLQFEKTTLIPSYSGLVRRTVQVEELIGGALLTQSEQNHNFNLKAIRPLGESDWKGKARIGYKKELLRESNDEGWGDGLFDYNKFVLGVEVEKETQGRLRSFRTGLEYFSLHYPNFSSLASSGFDSGISTASLGAEITSGTDVLDLFAIDWLTSWDWQLWDKTFLSFSTLLSPRFYTDAKIINQSGTFDSDERFDFYFWNAANYQHVFDPWTLFSMKLKNTFGFMLGFNLNESDQNDFDADQVRFNENYYSYYEYQAGPRWTTVFNKKLEWGLGYTFTQRLYSDRPVQSQTGDYVSGTINNEIHNFMTNLTYPIWKGISGNVSYAYQVAKSNQKFEQTYRYNYDSSHFFIGVSYRN